MRAGARVGGTWRATDPGRARGPAAGARLGGARSPRRRDLDHRPDRRLGSRSVACWPERRRCRCSRPASSRWPPWTRGSCSPTACRHRTRSSSRRPRGSGSRSFSPRPSAARASGYGDFFAACGPRRDPRRRARPTARGRRRAWSWCRCAGTSSSSSTTSFRRRSRRLSCSLLQRISSHPGKEPPCPSPPSSAQPPRRPPPAAGGGRRNPPTLALALGATALVATIALTIALLATGAFDRSRPRGR